MPEQPQTIGVGRLQPPGEVRPLSQRRLGMDVGRRSGTRQRQEPAGRLGLQYPRLYRAVAAAQRRAGIICRRSGHAIGQRCQTPLAMFICPARRRAVAYPDGHPGYGMNYTTMTGASLSLNLAARTDYAINAGDTPQTWICPDVGSASSDASGRKMEDTYHWAVDAQRESAMNAARLRWPTCWMGPATLICWAKNIFCPDRYERWPRRRGQREPLRRFRQRSLSVNVPGIHSAVRRSNRLWKVSGYDGFGMLRIPADSTWSSATARFAR